MRTIKFRAWDKSNGNMLSWEDINELDANGFAFLVDMIQDELNYAVMQYTGLHDKNGKEIYEGDIVHCEGGNEHQGYREFSKSGVIEFSVASFEVATQSDSAKVFYNFEHFNKEDVAVIGNIYENPELLEVSQ